MNISIRRNNGVFEAESRLWYARLPDVSILELSKSIVRACYVAIPLYLCGFLTLGAAIQKHLSVGALVMGWGIAELATMINTVAVYAYGNDCFPKHQVQSSQEQSQQNSHAPSPGRNQCFDQPGENSWGCVHACNNVTSPLRICSGFSVAYFQVPWALKNGAIQTFGCEAA